MGISGFTQSGKQKSSAHTGQLYVCLWADISAPALPIGRLELDGCLELERNDVRYHVVVLAFHTLGRQALILGLVERVYCP